MTIDPNHPVLVAAHAVANRTKDGEPVAMMVEAATEVLEAPNSSFAPAIESVRVVKGIWPYADPGRLVADELGLTGVTTALTRIGGNAAYDLVNHTAAEIAAGELSVALICGAETMRTRRADKAAGNRSAYLPEADDALPGVVVGNEVELTDEHDAAAGVHFPVNFYAMVESVIRHRNGEDPTEHLTRISKLWAGGSEVASKNPDAWMAEPVSAEEIATPSESNRMVAAPYTKLLTSNINVDQGAAMLLCSYGAAVDHGVPETDMVFLLAGSGASDHIQIRGRDRLDVSPAFDAIAHAALTDAGLTIDAVDHLDLYSCFPAAVQLAQSELGLDGDRPFTITGGLTFAGGPFNGYCTQALAKATELLQGSNQSAFLYGNGGYFSKHSVIVLSGAPPAEPFAYSRPQAIVDQAPTRPIGSGPTDGQIATIEAYTVRFDRQGAPTNAILSVLDEAGSRHWAVVSDTGDLTHLLDSDAVSEVVTLGEIDSPVSTLSARLTSN